MIKTLRSLAVLVIVFNLTFAAMCGGPAGDGQRIAAIRAALRASPALVAPLVAKGIITQAQADGVVKDFTDGADVALQLKQDFDAIPVGAADRKQRQYQAMHNAYNKWKVIVDRGHFGIASQIETAFAIADGIWLFADAWYADQAGVTSHSDVGADGLSPSEFRDALDQKIKDLNAAMKPQP